MAGLATLRNVNLPTGSRIAALRSLLASVGGRAAFHCAGEIERAAKGGDLVAAAALHGELGESTELLRTALIAFVRGAQPSC
jgi:hypothetical protein